MYRCLRITLSFFAVLVFAFPILVLGNPGDLSRVEHWFRGGQASSSSANKFGTNFIHFGGGSGLGISQGSFPIRVKSQLALSVPSTYSIPNSILKSASVEEYQSSLSELLKLADRRSSFELFDLYQFDNFLECLRGQPEFEDFVFNLNEQFLSSKKFCKKMRMINGFGRYKFQEFIAKEAEKITKQRACEASTRELVAKNNCYEKIHSTLLDTKKSYSEPAWLKKNFDFVKQKRLAAIEQIINGNECWTKKRYRQPALHSDLEKSRSVPPSMLQELYGNQLQHVVHKEFLDALKSFSSFYTSGALHSFDQQFVQSAVRFADVGVEHNHCGRIQESMYIADFCHAAAAYLAAIPKGVLKAGIQRALHLVNDPVGFCKDLVTGPIVLAGYLCKVVGAKFERVLLCLQDRDQYVKCMVEDEMRFLSAVEDYFEEYSGLQIVEHSAELIGGFALDMYLGHKTIQAFSHLHRTGIAQCCRAQSLYKKLLVPQASAAAAGAEYKLPVTAEEISSVLNSQEVCSTAANITEQVMLEQQSLVGTSPGIVKNIPVPGNKIVKQLLLPDYAETMKPQLTSFLPKQISPIMRTCPETGLQVHISMPLQTVEHIFLPELSQKVIKGKINERLLGFHHDYNGVLRKSGRVEYIDFIEGPGGTYGTTMGVKINGIAYDSTKSFFPEQMPPQEILNAICEVSREAPLVRNKSGRFSITGVTKFGFDIEIYLESSGKTITAYPVIPELKMKRL